MHYKIKEFHEKQNLTQFAFEYGKDNAYDKDISKACSLLVKYAQ